MFLKLEYSILSFEIEIIHSILFNDSSLSFMCKIYRHYSSSVLRKHFCIPIILYSFILFKRFTNTLRTPQCIIKTSAYL